MGVSGLLSYVKDKSGSLTVAHYLHHCDLVIDGNNLIHYLYHTSRTEWRFGGEFDLFAAAVRHFFTQLAACGVTCRVLFDGCYQADDAKFGTIVRRARDRLYTLRSLNKRPQAPAGRLLPILAPRVVVEVLDELGVDHLTCPDEADLNIAALAAQLGCPVLSNDSDFCIFDLPGGVVSLDSMEAFPSKLPCQCCPEGSHMALSCAIYRVERLRGRGLEPCFLPLMATLLGNDLAAHRDLAVFFQKVKLPRPAGRAGRRHAKADSLMRWLSNFDTPEAALAAVENHLSADRRPSVRSLVETSLAQYRLERAWIHERSRRPASLDALPEAAWAALQRRRLEPFLVNASVCGFVFLPHGPEALQLPSAHDGTRPVRTCLYAALGCGADNAPVEYGRRDGNLVKEKVHGEGPCRFCDLEAAVAELSGGGPVQVWPAEGPLKPLLLLLTFWCRRCPVEPVHITALLLSLTCRLDDKELLPRDLWEPDEALEAEERQRRRRQVAKYLEPPPLNNAKPLDLPAVHAFVAFQTCLQAFDQLAAVGALEQPGPCPPPVHHMLAGRLFYNLRTDLRRRSEASLFIHELLGRRSRLNAWFWTAHDHLQALRRLTT